jgi:hypothetical protein
MLSYAESSFIVAMALISSCLMVAVLNRVWPMPRRKLVNDVTGWQLGILGTTYGVILGFMLYTVWTDFRNADTAANLEASALLNVYRVAEGLPLPQRDALQALAAKYADVTINQEWPAMRHQEESQASALIGGKMWRVVTSTRTSDGADSVSLDHLTSAMKDLTERRNLRDQVQAIHLPTILWLLLLSGGVATVGSSCLLGNDNEWLHYCQVFALTFVVAVTLSAIADLARPFEGSVCVTPVAFVHVLETMSEGTLHH